MPPNTVPTSKNIVNDPMTTGRSRSSTRLTVSAISDGYMNAMPTPMTTADAHSAQAAGNDASAPSAAASVTNAIVTARRAPRRSGRRAPTRRSSRQTML